MNAADLFYPRRREGGPEDPAGDSSGRAQRVGELEPDALAFPGGIEVARGDRVVTLHLVPPLVADV